MRFKTILFDFDGVLSKGRFYEKTLLSKYPEIYAWIQDNIFGNKELVRQWMKNEINSASINKMISEKTGIEFELLKKLYEESISQMELEKGMIDLAKALISNGKKIGIVTDNMDVFTQITIPNHGLDKIFDVIINSADYGILKNEENGKLFDLALDLLNVNISSSLMIDDSSQTVELFKKKGGEGILFNNISQLQQLLSEY